MGIVSFLAIYLVIWWLTFYVVLAFGRRDADPVDAQVRGADRGAPARPFVWRRVGATSALALVVFGLFYALVSSGIGLQDIPLPSPPRLGE